MDGFGEGSAGQKQQPRRSERHLQATAAQQADSLAGTISAHALNARPATSTIVDAQFGALSQPRTGSLRPPVPAQRANHIVRGYVSNHACHLPGSNVDGAVSNVRTGTIESAQAAVRGNGRQYFCNRCRKTFAGAKELHRHIEHTCEPDRLLACRHCSETFSRPYKRSIHHAKAHSGCLDPQCTAAGAHVQHSGPQHHALGCGLCADPPQCFYHDAQGYRKHHMSHCHHGARQTHWNTVTQLGNLLHQPDVVDVWLSFGDVHIRGQFLHWCVATNLSLIGVLEGSPSTQGRHAHALQAISALRPLYLTFLQTDSASQAAQLGSGRGSGAPANNTVPPICVFDTAAASAHLHESALRTHAGIYAVWDSRTDYFLQQGATFGQPFDLGPDEDMLDLDNYTMNEFPCRPEPTSALDAVRGSMQTPFERAPHTMTATDVATYGTSPIMDDGTSNPYAVDPALLYQQQQQPNHAPYAALGHHGYALRDLDVEEDRAGSSQLPILPTGCRCNIAFACPVHHLFGPGEIPSRSVVAHTGTQPFATINDVTPASEAGAELGERTAGQADFTVTDMFHDDEGGHENDYNRFQYVQEDGYNNVYGEEELYGD